MYRVYGIVQRVFFFMSHTYGCAGAPSAATYVSAYVDTYVYIYDTHVYIRVYNLDGGFGIEHEGHEAAIHRARLAQQRPPQQQLLRDGWCRV